MPHPNNIFASIVTFIIAGGFFYVGYNPIMSLIDTFSADIKTFALVTFFALMLLGLLGLPLLMMISTDEGAI